ncbi:MAG: hypothetical protein ACOYT9_00575 [Patescibacteria group bacterium]
MNHVVISEIADQQWKRFYKISAMVALIMVVIVPVQSFIFITWPPPSTALGYFTLFHNNWLLGFLSLDLLLTVNNVLLIIIYLALYATLRSTNQPLMTIGLILSLVGVAAYFSSNTSFEMFSLSKQYYVATTETEKSALLATGQGMLTIYTGTAFNVYYILNAISLLIFSLVQLRSSIFSRSTAYSAMLAAVFMLVPPTVGTIGIYLSLLSLVPWTVWLILFARRLFQLARIQDGRHGT